MIGLTFLAIGLLWLAFSVFVGRKLPRWLGIRNRACQWAVTAAAVAALLIGPFVDHVVGMRQFERLCAERTIVRVSPDSAGVKRAMDAKLPTVELPGYWIKIRTQPVAYIDMDTGKVFVEYQILHTKGGKIGAFLYLGNDHSCGPKDYGPKRHLDIEKLLKNGKGEGK